MVHFRIKTLKAPFGALGAAYLSGLFNITKAAITPGTQPQSVSKNTIIIDPHPLSITAKGGNNIDKITRKQPIVKISIYWTQRATFCYGILKKTIVVVLIIKFRLNEYRTPINDLRSSNF